MSSRVHEPQVYGTTGWDAAPDQSRRGQVVYARRMQTRYLVARGHPSPEQLRARLDESSGITLRETLATLLASHIDPADDAVWLIRQLDIDVSMNTAWDRNRLAQKWAQGIALALVQVLSAGADGVNVVKFDSPSEYLSRFLGDLLAGGAWSRWYYRAFDGLRTLPISSAIRTAIGQDPVVGFDALLALSPAVLVHVLATLSVQDASQVLRMVPSARSVVTGREALDLVWQVYERLHGTTDLDGETRATLRLVIEAVRLRPNWSGEKLSSAARALVTLMRVSGTHPELLPTLRRAVLHSSVPALYATLSTSDAESLMLLLDTDVRWFDRVVRAVTHAETRAEIAWPTREEHTAHDIRSTPFGGAFLLLPLLTSIPFEAIAGELPTCNDASAVSLLRFLVLSKCLGGATLPRLMFDPVIRDLLKIDPRLTVHDIVQWLGQRTIETQFPVNTAGKITRQDARYLAFPPFVREPPRVRRALGRLAIHVLRDFSRRLPGFAQASFPHLYANFLSMGATLEQQPDRRVVTLNRPPLDIILNMTGMARATYGVPWLDHKPFVLFPESAT